MKFTNRTLAIFGIATFLFSVYSTATINGVPSEPQYIITSSFIVSILFTIFAVIRIWKIKKVFSLLFALINVLEFSAEFIKEIKTPSDGSTLILAINIVKILSFLSFIYAIVVLWKKQNDYDN